MFGKVIEGMDVVDKIKGVPTGAQGPVREGRCRSAGGHPARPPPLSMLPRSMDFVFMLTRSDRTIPNWLEVLDEIRPLGLKHVGFKDVGIAPDAARELAARAQGARARPRTSRS